MPVGQHMRGERHHWRLHASAVVPGATTMPSGEPTTGPHPGRRSRGPVPGDRRRRRAGEGGYSLIEVLIAVMLAGTVIAALAAGMLTMVTSTRSVSEQQRLEAGVLSYTEWLRSQPFSPCAGPSTYPTWEGTPGVSGNVIRVRHWTRSAGQAWGDGSYGTSCTTTTHLGRQLLDVRVQLTGGGPSTTAQVVLREEP